MIPTITAFERSPDRGKGLARAIAGMFCRAEHGRAAAFAFKWTISCFRLDESPVTLGRVNKWLNGLNTKNGHLFPCVSSVCGRRCA